MKRFFCFFSLLFLSYVGFAQEYHLRLMTYNLRFGELASMEQIGQMILHENPDWVSVQECDWNAMRGKTPQQHHVCFTNVLASETKMFSAYGKTIPFCGGYYGIGLLSRYPLLKVERVNLPFLPKTEQRVLLISDVEMPDGQIIRLVSTHLEAYSSQARREQVKFLHRLLKSSPMPVFLAGDMNAEPDSPEMQYLVEKGWQNLTNDRPTWSVEQPDEKLDYIFFYTQGKSKMEVELKETHRLTNVKLSDHFPIVSEIVLRPMPKH